MSFGNEVQEFLAAYMAVSEMGDKRKERKADREYRDAMLELQTRRVDLEERRLEKAGSGGGGDGRASLAAARLDHDRNVLQHRQDVWKAEQDAAKFGNMATSLAAGQAAGPPAAAVPPDAAAVGGSNPPPNAFIPGEYWDDGPLQFKRGGMVARPGYARGGMVRSDELERRSALPVPPDSVPRPDPIGVTAQGRTSRPGMPVGSEAGRTIAGLSATPGVTLSGAPRGADPFVSPVTPQEGAIPAKPAARPWRVPNTGTSGSERAAPTRDLTESQPDESPERVKALEQASEIVVTRARDAADAAVRSFSVDMERPAAAVDDTRAAPGMDIVANRGGLSMEEYEAVLQKVDPNGAMPAHLKSAAVLAEGYRYFLERGDHSRAEIFARQILITQKAMSQTLGALSLQAIEQGDLQSACRLFNDACNRFPSGHEIEVRPDDRAGLVYRVNENGKEVEVGRLNTEQFWELTEGVANGSAFLTEISQFAAQSRERPMTPERAIEATIAARGAAEDAIAELNDAIASGIKGEELREIQRRAQEAADGVPAARQRAISAGAKRTDVDAAVAQAARVRVPPVPDELLNPKPGWFSRMWAGSPDYTESDPPTAPPTGAPPAGASAIQTAPASAASAAPSVTPPGNLRPPSPDVMQRARAAIAAGAPAEQVKQRLREAGFSTEGF